MKDYYAISFILDIKEHYCIWYTNDLDGVITNGNDRIVQFINESELHEYCTKSDIILSSSQENMALYDLDKLNEWLREEKTAFDNNLMLNLWNIISDVARSLNKPFIGDDDKMLFIYDKLFHANNLPAYMPSDKEYTPNWDKDEIAELRFVLSNGIQIIKNGLFS